MSTTVTFNYTGSQQTWTVPSGVNSITITSYGASGGNNDNSSFGGKGGSVTGTYNVTPGETLYINVGGVGGNAPTTTNTRAAGGWNGGGIGGTITNGGSARSNGAGGGGASDVRQGGTALSNRIIVAGGGGGGGGDRVSGLSQGCGGGGGGGYYGGAGGTSGARSASTGGTQTGGGVGGTTGGGVVGSSGAFGVGGNGADDTASSQGGDGLMVTPGGNGGYTSGSDGTYLANSWAGGSGGGGSSYLGNGTNTSYSNGVQTGNGQVVISYEPIVNVTSNDTLAPKLSETSIVLQQTLFSSDILAPRMDETSSIVYSITNTDSLLISQNLDTNDVFKPVLKVTSSDTSSSAFIDQIADMVMTPTQNWFTLFDNKLDGSYHPIPGSVLSDQVGWWSNSLSNPDGSFTTPPTIDLQQFDGSAWMAHNIQMWADPNAYPVDFVVTYYNGATTVYTQTVTGNTDSNWASNPPDTYQVDKIEVRINKISTAGKPVRIWEMHTIDTLAHSDNVLVALVEGATVTILSTNVSSVDTLTPKLTESSTITVTLSSVDTLTPKLIEGTSSMTASLNASDSLTPKMDESIPTITNSFVVSDIITPKLTEAESVTNSLSNVDTLTPKLSEGNTVITASISNVDILTPRVDESAPSVIASLNTSDTLTPRTDDSTLSITNSFSSTDALTPKLYESNLSISNSLGGTDVLTPNVTESVAITNSFGAGDTLTPKAVDSSFFTQYEIWSNETLTPRLDESTPLVTNSFSSTDTITPKLDDSVVSMSNSLSNTDTLTPKLNESVAVTNSLSNTDILTPKTDEGASFITNSFVGSDILTPKTDEGAPAITNSFSSFDILTPKVSETISITVTFTSTDIVSVSSNLSEQYSVTAQMIGTDSILVKVNETNSITNQISNADTILIKFVESVAVTNKLSSADTINPKITNESSSITAEVFALDNILVSQNTEDVLDYSLGNTDVFVVTLEEVTELTNIYTVMDADVRQVHGKVVITYTDPFMDEAVTMTSSQTAPNTDPQQLADNIITPAYKWFSLHDNVLDGSYHPLPGNKEYSVGLWGTDLSNPDGTLPNPLTVAVSMSARTITKLRIVGDSILNVFPTDFTFNAYDTNGVKLNSWVFTGNTSVDFEYTLPTSVSLVTKLEIVITKINKGGVSCKLTEMYTAVVETYVDDDIESINLLEEIGYSTGGLPIGNISANEVDITLYNKDKRFDLGNIQSPLYSWIRRNRRVEVYLGSVVDPNVGIEWHSMGTFWTSAWDIQKDSIITNLTARDRLELLRISQFTNTQVYQNKTLYDLFGIVFQDAGLASSDYSIDTGLQNITIPYAWFDRMSHRDALQRLAGCGIIQVYCGKDNIIYVHLNLNPSTNVMVTFDDDTNVYGSKFPLAVSEQTNWIEVTSTKWSVGVSTTLYDDDDFTSVPAGGTVTNTYQFQQTPAMSMSAPVVTADADITVQSYTLYAWGCEITFHNTGAAAETVHHVTISGVPLTQSGSRVMIAKNDASIASDGIIKQTVQHDLIQDASYAQDLANNILSTYSTSRHDVTLDNRGSIALRLEDKVDVTDPDGTTEYMVTRQNVQWAGYLSATTEAKKI